MVSLPEFKTLLLIYSHSKRIIRESIRNDTQFLADANIMDYSLLVGVDDERRELVVGIVGMSGWDLLRCNQSFFFFLS